MKKKVGLILSFLISIAFLLLALRKVNVKEIGDLLLNADLLYFFLAMLITFVAFLLRAIRWKILLKPLKNLPLSMIFNTTMIGFMCNYTLPARVGEVIRAYLIGKKGGISKSAAFATIIVERVMDIFILSLFAAIVLIFFTVPDYIEKIGITIIIMNFLIFIILLFMHKKSEAFIRILEKPLSIFGEKIKEKIKTFLFAFTKGLNIMKNFSDFSLAFFLSLLIWSITGLIFYVLFFSLQMHLPLHAAFLDMIIMTFGIMIPSTSGFIGTFQFFVKEGLMIFQIDPNIALSYSILLYTSQFLLVVGTGLICLWLFGLKLKNLRIKVSSYNLSEKKQKE